MDSIERQAQRNPFELSGLFGYEPGGTVYARVARVAGSEGMVGYALDALREARFGAHSKRLILLDYEALTRAPGVAMTRLYELLGEPRFAHDFENVAYEAEAFDAALGTPSLHEVRGRVEWQPRATVLPADLFERFAHDSFWRRPQPRLAHVPAISGVAAEGAGGRQTLLAQHLQRRSANIRPSRRRTGQGWRVRARSACDAAIQDRED